MSSKVGLGTAVSGEVSLPLPPPMPPKVVLDLAQLEMHIIFCHDKWMPLFHRGHLEKEKEMAVVILRTTEIGNL